ncbi:Myblike DNA-binding domain containing protein [Carpediemonas membranifera]|uniref:Myblike DNA-binding domain containing protein n=1 Tax=Carpediemonas membranifera TaxID=201153 RepID=A0A8J6E2J3_9EUKA|nr:Myblike DNA-binding domain containing protein [Carpediemonas membranifera]|eukprot:KAG9391972.1 Myblike DNA-binding domain containing protein [Carpediemonas membranifera]
MQRKEERHERPKWMEALVQNNLEMRSKQDKLLEHNMRLLLLLKEKEQKIRKQELVIRKYRSRLVRWFEDMQYDPMDEIPDAEMDDADVGYVSEDDKELPRPGGQVKINLTRKAVDVEPHVPGAEGVKRAKVEDTPEPKRENVSVPPNFQRHAASWTAADDQKLEAAMARGGPLNFDELRAQGVGKTDEEIQLHVSFLQAASQSQAV